MNPVTEAPSRVAVVADGDLPTQRSRHVALVHRGAAELATALGDIVGQGAASGARVLVALPTPVLDRVRAASPVTDGVDWVDLGAPLRNPARLGTSVLGPFVRKWPGEALTMVCEGVVPGGSGAERAVAFEQEAAFNLLFHDRPVTLICPFDRHRLGPDALLEACRTHPEIAAAERSWASTYYVDPLMYLSSRPELSPAPRHAKSIDVLEAADVRRSRALARTFALQANLPPGRAADFELAVAEATTNMLRHGRPPSTVSLWREGKGVTCQLHDSGELLVPLSGRGSVRGRPEGGYGFPIMHELCDLVQIRSPRGGGTTVRLRMYGRSA
jgi:anti-sigma regulatory factor (Ser/Thr protein kinase)